MKPKTQFEKDIVRYAKTLAQISDKHRQQAYDKCFPHEAWYMGRDFECFCTECGADGFSIDDPKSETVVCPNCGKRLNLKKTRKTKEKIRKHFCIFTTTHGIQVVRYMEVDKQIHRFEKHPISHSSIEICRLWLLPDGKYKYEARKKGRIFYSEYWRYGTPIELKEDNDYNFYADAVYSPQMIIPRLKRNGFSGDLHGEPPADCFILLLKEPKYETLWKAKFFDVINNSNDMNQIRLNWNPLKICIRNNYHPKDIKIWYDTMGNLRELNKDTQNPHYVCPDDLDSMHLELVRQIDIKRAKAAEEERRKFLRKESVKLLPKSCYFGICFGNENLTVTVLSSIFEYEEESKKMHHCVFSNRYYAKEDSLILSAKDKEGQRLATIELSLKSFKVLQCRAACNTKPERYDEIVGLVESHATDFRKAKKLQPCKQ